MRKQRLRDAHSPHPVGQGRPAAASSDSPWAASHIEALSAQAPTCDAEVSGSHTPLDSVQNIRQIYIYIYKIITFAHNLTMTIIWLFAIFLCHITCISWIMALNCGERSVHCFSSSMALSKFFTYSAYILRKGVSFCRMSPIRGVDPLQLAKDSCVTTAEICLQKICSSAGFCWYFFLNGQDTRGWKKKVHCCCSPFSHAFLQIWKQELAVKSVNGGDVGEDVLHYVHRKCSLVGFLHQLCTENLWKVWYNQKLNILFSLLRCVYHVTSCEKTSWLKTWSGWLTWSSRFSLVT